MGISFMQKFFICAVPVVVNIWNDTLTKKETRLKFCLYITTKPSWLVRVTVRYI